MDRRFRLLVICSAACWALPTAVGAIRAAGAAPPLRLAASGVLERQTDSRGVRYTLKDARGETIYQVSPADRVDLGRFVGQQVEVIGSLQTGHRAALREIRAHSIAPIERVVPAHFLQAADDDPPDHPPSDPPPGPADAPRLDPIPQDGPPMQPLPDLPDYPDLPPPLLEDPAFGEGSLIFEGPRNSVVGGGVLPNSGYEQPMRRFEAYDNPHSRYAACGPPHRIWGNTEYLYWWTKGARVPPLLTTSPPGTDQQDAGVLGMPGTSVLFGDSRLFEDDRSGWRWVYGIWLGSRQRLGLQVDAIALRDERMVFRAASNGVDILARPFFNVDPNLGPAQGPDAELISYPNVAAGSLDIDAWNRFRSLGIQLRGNLLCNAGCDAGSGSCFSTGGAGYRVDLLGGYRYMELEDRLNIRQLTAVSIAPQAGFDVLDRFATENQFHGGELGLLAQWQRSRWAVDGVVKLALGRSGQRVAIDGVTEFSDDGVATPVVGGLLAQTTNIGQYKRRRTDLIPEFGLNAGYLLLSNLRIHAGYRIIYWPRVVRAGDQIDLTINGSYLDPDVLPRRPARPEFAFRETSFWAQGLSAGFDYRW